MDNDNLNIYISRILSGSYIFLYANKRYTLAYPDISLRYEADIYADSVYAENRFNDWISEDDILHYLVSAGIWDYSGDDRLKNIEKQIEDLKVDLFKSSLNPTKQKTIKRSLSSHKKLYDKMFNIRHSFDHLTSRGFANLIKNQFILAHSILDHNNKLVFNLCNEDFDLNLMNNIMEYISLHTIDIPTFKKIARSDIWRNYWSANKDYLFDRAVINWTDEQKTLVVLTRMYDSAYENPDCPADNVFEDDDMFDGWLIHQRRENEKIRSKNRAEKMFGGKLDRAQEVFVMANSKEEAEAIYGLNDSSSKNIIKERNTAIFSAKKDIKEAELPDVQRNLLIENNKKFIQSRKG